MIITNILLAMIVILLFAIGEEVYKIRKNIDRRRGNEVSVL
jgi:hypothetical protein